MSMHWLRSVTSVLGAPPVMEGKDGGLARLVPPWREVSPVVMSPDNEDADMVRMLYSEYLDQGYEPDDIPMQLEEIYKGVYKDFRARAQTFTNPLRVYRMVQLRSPDDLRLDPIGRYWSWDARNVESYGFSGYEDMPREFLLVGEVDAEDVDWFETTLRNTVRESEQEITVKRGHRVRLLAVLDEDGKVVSTDVREARANPRRR
jgi:hypothetical protein